MQLARATLQVARAHLALEEYDSARTVVREVLEEMEIQARVSRPARLELMNGMGYEYLRLSQTVLARSMFLKARSLAPYHADAWLGLARTYRREGDDKSAREHYEKVLELDRNHLAARRELERLLSDGEGR
jgi:Flp pilus assembly protein TadD